METWEKVSVGRCTRIGGVEPESSGARSAVGEKSVAMVGNGRSSRNQDNNLDVNMFSLFSMLNQCIEVIIITSTNCPTLYGGSERSTSAGDAVAAPGGRWAPGPRPAHPVEGGCLGDLEGVL